MIVAFRCDVWDGFMHHLEGLGYLQKCVICSISSQLRPKSFGRCQQVSELALREMAYQVKRQICCLRDHQSCFSPQARTPFCCKAPKDRSAAPKSVLSKTFLKGKAMAVSSVGGAKAQSVLQLKITFSHRMRQLKSMFSHRTSKSDETSNILGLGQEEWETLSPGDWSPERSSADGQHC